MLKWFDDLISSDSAKSSGRLLNLFGGIIFGGVYIADFITHKTFNIDATSILAIYYAGVYGTSGAISWAKGKLDVNK